MIAAIEKSKGNDLSRLIYALGIRHVGQKTGKLLAQHFHTMDELAAADLDALVAVDDIGLATAESLKNWFALPESQRILQRLQAAGVCMESRQTVTDTRFAGMTFVLTGALSRFTRDRASELIEQLGGRVSSSVSKNTS